MQVEKRDGRIVDFSQNKIYEALVKCFKETREGLTQDDFKNIENLTQNIVKKLTKPVYNVEEIQDIVENELIKQNFAIDAKHYIIFRNTRSKQRNSRNALTKILKNVIADKSTTNDLKRENANIDADTSMGTMLKIGSEASKDFALKYLINPKFATEHLNGDIHIHDLDFYPITMNCMQIPLGKLLERGFNTGHGNIRKPQSILSASALACIILQANQNEMYGGQSFPMWEYDLAPYVSKSFFNHFLECFDDYFDTNIFTEHFKETDICDKYVKYHKTILDDSAHEFLKLIMTETDEIGKTVFINSVNFDDAIFEKLYQRAIKKTDKEVHQAMQAVIHNLNTMQSRAGAQVPFSSLNYGTGTTHEERMIIKALLEETDKGLGHSETPIFPVQIFKLKDGINTKAGDPNFDLFELACKVSAKRLFPNFSFIDSPYNLQYYKEGRPETEVAIMGCVSYDAKINIFNPFTKTYSNPKIGDFVKYNNALDYLVFDTSVKKYVKIKNVINNPKVNDWYDVEFELTGKTTEYQTIRMTSNHYLPVISNDTTIRTITTDLKVGDCIPCQNDVFGERKCTISKIEKLDINEKSYCLETETDRFDIDGINSHNCRTRVAGNTFDKENEIFPGRGNVFFTTINLPRLGLDANHNIDLFFNLFDQRIDDCIKQLEDRFELISHKHVYNYPFLMGEGVYLGSDKLNWEDEIGEVLKQGSLSIGFIGLAECLVALTGKHHGEDENSRRLGLRIIKHLRERLDNYSKISGLNWSCFATPAESLSGKFVKIDKKKYGIIPGVTDRDYYTNSFHIPVYYNISIFNKIKYEAPYHELCNAGAISYVEIDGDLTKNVKAFESIVLYAKQNNLGYFSINHPVDRCPVCGYVGIIGDECPRCGFTEKDGVKLEHLKQLGIRCSC